MTSMLSKIMTMIGRLAGTINPRGGLDVNIQDQASEIIDLHFTQLVQDLTIITNTAIDDSTITVSTIAEPVNGNMVCLKEGLAFYQGLILSHVANGPNWDITLDTPLDYAYTVAGGCSENTKDLNVNGNITIQEFEVGPAGLDPTTSWHINRILFQITDQTVMDDAKFGGLPALSKGLVVRSVDGSTKNIFNVKTNADLGLHAYDITYSDKAPAGFFGFRCRRSFNGQDKNGVVVALHAATGDTLKVIIQDDLTGLDTFEMVAQGHIVED